MNFRPEDLENLTRLSDDELTAELARQIKQKQADGTLGELEKMVRIMTPFLSSDQKARLAKIIAAAMAAED